ncbi:MAG: DUF1844 domain-containing protein [Candidatus Omnitrophica bacterium]|nr:DUF1844 domain-containing protein [Candidatus Omnitrophota bacterium]MCM8806616.1 DUF1844 domain-containing protein [Candidatus Omnitrophota bacterium]
MKNMFNFIVDFFAEMGWRALGKITNPMTGKIEKNLELAKQIIEILETLKEKTKGNLTDEENRFLITTITDLQLNYVEEVEKESKQKNGTDKGET